MFQKRKEHKITYKSGGAQTQIDYMLVKRSRDMKIKDCKGISGEEILKALLHGATNCLNYGNRVYTIYRSAIRRSNRYSAVFY